MSLTKTFSIVANNAASGTTLTTGTFDSTGYTHLVVFCKHEGAPTTISVTDNKSSGTLTGLTKVNHSNGDLSVQLHHADIGTPGTGHTVTMTLAASRAFRDCEVWLVGSAGTVTLDVQAAGGQGTGTAADAGTLTTSAASVSFMGVSEDTAAATYTPSSGWTEDSDTNENFTASRADATSGTFDPSCTVSTSVDWAAVAASFIEVSSATLEQEGFRFGEDDGNEASHTFTAAQDTSIMAAAGTKLLRVLVNATGDPLTAAYTLRAQKNGSGGYTAVGVGSTTKTQPVIEAADVTESGNNTASASWAISHPAASTGDLLIWCVGWDDSTTTTGLTQPSGPNGETISNIEAVAASSSTSVRGKVMYTVATGAWSAGTLTFTPSASEQWSAQVIRVPAGEFDSSTPIGAHNNLPSSTTGNPTTPTLTAGASDGSGTLIAFVVGDTDNADGSITGWTSLANTDRGAVGVNALRRDLAVSNSESVSAETGLTYPAGRDWVSFNFVVRAPSVSNEVYVDASANISSGGEATTARLTAPSGKSTSDFVTGRRWDNENGSDSIDITTDDYTEVEWCITLAGSLSNGDYFDFEVYAGSTVLDTYTVTPRWTIGSSGSPYTLTADVGTFSLTGNVTALKAARKIATTVSTFTLTGISAGLTAQRKLAATVGTFALTGIDATLTYTPVAASYTLTADAGSFALTGVNTILTAQRKIAPAVGTFALSGIAVTLKADRSIAAGTGSFSFTGIDATLTYTPVVGAYTLIAETGSFVLTGNDSTLFYQAIQSQQATGGYGLSIFEYASLRRRKRKQMEKQREEDERQIQEDLDRQIAQTLYEQELKDLERADLTRIQNLADRLMTERTELPRPILASVIKASEERSHNALAQLERLIHRQVEEEEISVLLILLNDH